MGKINYTLLERLRKIKHIHFIAFVLIIGTSFLMHYPHLKKDLMSVHVWRQTQTQSTIVNFYEEDMNILNPRRNERGATQGIFRMEFPLMQWIVACFYKLFGNHIIITRLIMFVIGLFTTLGMYKLLFYLFSNRIIPILGAWALTFSPAFFYYTINPLPDNLALCCSIWGVSFFFRWLTDKKSRYLIFCSIFLSIGSLCKLPFIIYCIVPFIYFFFEFLKKGLSRKLFAQGIYFVIPLFLPMSWYVYAIPQWGSNMVIKGMLNSNESIIELLDYLQHNLISTLPELLLNYGSLPFFITGFYYLIKQKKYRSPKFKFVLSWSIVVLIYFFFELNAISKIHDYYLFPFYTLLFILVAYGAYKLLQTKKRFFIYGTFILLLALPFLCHLRMNKRWKPESPGFNKDLLKYKTELQNAVPKDKLVVAGNDISHYIFFYYIDKKGWAFDNNKINGAQLQKMISQGAGYLYSDSRKIEQDPKIKIHLDSLLLNKGSIHIYKLKDVQK